MQHPIVADKELIGYCGLYCGACKRYLGGKCPGCAKNEKALWCKTRSCCKEKKISSCADCTDFASASDCKKFNNLFSKMFGLIFRSNRQGCIDRIKKVGLEKFAAEMAGKKKHSLPK